MIKLKLILFIFLLVNLGAIFAMSQDEIILEKDSPELEQFSSALHALWDGDINSFLKIIETNRIDINNVFDSENGYNIFGQALQEAADMNTLELVRHLLQYGADVNHPIRTKNATYLPNLTALQSVIQFDIDSWSKSKPKLILDFIKLLLGYGAVIDNKTEELVKIKSSELQDHDNIYAKVLQLFDDHRMTINEAKAEPTQELLLQAINNDQPYIVRLITENKPELVTSNNIKLAESNSPSSLISLKKAINLPKFKKFAHQIEFPHELIEHVKKFILHK